MEFQRFQVHSDPPAKRCNVDPTASPVRSMLSFQESIVAKTPDHPDNYFIREPIRLESPCTPSKLIPQAAFIHISSSPVLANPSKSSQSRTEKGGACLHSNTSSLSLDSSLNTTNNDYLDISGTQTIPSSSPGADVANDTESSLGSELNNMSSVFFPNNKASSSQTTDDQQSNLAMSFSKSSHGSSQNNASLDQADESLEQESANDSDSHAVQDIKRSTTRDRADEVEHVDEDVANMHGSFKEDKSHEHMVCKSPATSTPQTKDCEQINRELSEDAYKFPAAKPINKLIKKVKFTFKSVNLLFIPHFMSLQDLLNTLVVVIVHTFSGCTFQQYAQFNIKWLPQHRFRSLMDDTNAMQ